MTDITQGQDVQSAAPKEAPEAAASAAPDVDDLFPKQDVDDLFPANYKPTSQPVRNVSPIQDMIFSNPGRAHARILDAFGYGFKQDWGAGEHENSEANEYFRKAGIYNDYAKGQRSIIKAANEAVMRPAVAAIVAAKSTFSGAFHGVQQAVVQTGEEYGAPNLAREIASIPEAFPTGFHQMSGVPHVPEHIAQARELNVIGSGEGGYFGTAPVEVEPAKATAEAAKVQGVAQPEGLPGHDAEAGPSPVAQGTATPAPEAAPDIHAVARQIAPETFQEFDALAQKKDTFRRWIDELREVRDENARTNAPHADEIAKLDDQIAEQQAKKGGYGKLQSLTSKRDALTEERDAYIAEHAQGDSADMAKVRQQLQEADYRQRDLAADVTKAYRDAEARMPQAEGAPEAPAAEAATHEPAPAETVPAQGPVEGETPAQPVAASAPAPAPQALIEGTAKASEAAGKQAIAPNQPEADRLPIAHAPSIVADVSQKLKAAGRPAEEADAAAQVVAAYWETRAQRFEGAKGTATEMYAREAPEIVAGKEKPSKAKKARELELAQTGGLDLGKELNQTAYHGSPYDFDVFDTGKIGTGEGAQAYGHGLYFAENRGVAKYYRDALSRDVAVSPRAYEDPVIGPRLKEAEAEYEAANQNLADVLNAGSDNEKISEAQHQLHGAHRYLEATTHEANEKYKPGALYRVDIKPEPEEFLQWDKPLREQPKLLKAIEKVVPRPGWLARQIGGLKAIRHEIAANPESTGEQAYGALSRLLGSDKAATNALRDAGVPGIRYLDQGSRNVGEGTHNYVVFDPKDIEILDKNGKAVSRKEFEQNVGGVKGRIRVRDDARNTITLMKTADASTFIHETAHDWLERMLDDARDEQAPQALRDDAQTVLKWLGAEGPDSVKTRHHEKFARGFETYMLEGRAPSNALARVFAQFRDWLTTIYKTAAALKSPISDDIRGVFDRLLAEKPEKTVIAPEREKPAGLTEKHGAVAEATPPERAHEVANTIEAERDSHSGKNLVENQDNDTRLSDTGAETEGRAPRSAQPAGDADASGAVRGEAGAAGGSGGVGEGGSEAADQSAGTRQKSERLNTAPTPLLRFLASKGGIKASDELIKDLRQSLGASNRLIPGFGQLIRQSKQLSSAARKAGRSEAMTIDRAREAAIEAGHLPEGASITDFLDAIDNEVRGIGHAIERPHDPAELEHAQHNFIEGLNDTVKEAGGAELSDAERARALELWKHEGLNDPHAILERLALEADDESIERGAPENTPGIVGWDVAAPGWELSGDARATSGAGEGAAGVGPEQPRGGIARTVGEIEDREPLTATEPFPRSDGPLIDKAGNIRLENINAPEDVLQVLRDSANRNNGFYAERRGVISDSEALSLAQALGEDPAFLDRKAIGTAYTKEEVFALEDMLVKSATFVRDAMAGTDEIAYAEAKARHLMIHDMIQAKSSAARAEAGRTLQAFAALKRIKGSQDAHALQDWLKVNTGKTLYQAQQEMKFGSKLPNPSAVSKFLNDSSKKNFHDAIVYYYVNALISGPITHARYSVGNAINAIWKPLVELPTAATIGALKEAAGVESKDRVYYGEAAAQLYAITKGSRDGLWVAIKAFQDGVSPALPGERISAHFAEYNQPIPGKIGNLIGYPGRGVAAIHSFFKQLRYEQEVQSLAYRKAMSENLSGDEFHGRVAQLTSSPTPEMMENSTRESLKELFMAPTDYHSAMGSLTRAVNQNLPAKIIIPFMKIGSQITRNAFVERTPLGLASKSVRDVFSEGGASADMQAAKMVTGVALMGTTVLMAAEGMATGDGPTDPKARAIWLLNHRPNSLTVGGVTMPYQGLGHLGMLMRFSANMYETGHYWDGEDGSKLAVSFFEGLTKSVIDENFLRGVKDMLDAVYHPEEYGASYLRNSVTAWIPWSVGLSQVAKKIDPYERETHTIFEAARAKIPFVSQGLFPRRDRFGEPIPNGGGLPQYQNDPVVQMLEKLNLGIAPVPKKIRGVELTEQQHDDFARVSGRMTKMLLTAFAKTPGMALMPDQVKRDKIREMVDKAREIARVTVIMQPDSNIMSDARKNKIAPLLKAPTP